MKPKLAITGITRLPEGYAGQPLTIDFDLTDKEGGVYEAGVEMMEGFNAAKLKDAVAAIMLQMDAEAVAVCIKNIKIKKK